MRRIVTTPRLTLAVAVLAFGLPLAVLSCSWMLCCDMGQMGPATQPSQCSEWASGSAMSCCGDASAVGSAVAAANAEGGVVLQAALPAVVSVPVSALVWVSEAVAPAPSGSSLPALFLLHASLLI